MRVIAIGAALGMALVVAAGEAIAASTNDALVITYRSGKMQTVPLEEPPENVQEIGFLREVPPGPEVKGRGFGKEGDAIPLVERMAPSAPRKGGTVMKWTRPVAE